MIFQNPDLEILTPNVGENMIKLIEIAGRTCYKSEDKITPKSARDFVKMLISRGHESVLEHVSVTVKITCDRGISHEIVRHRLASFSQESTRYCNYSKKGITYIKPSQWQLTEEDNNLLKLIEDHYNKRIAEGLKPEQARYFLPNGLKTEIVVTANLREWRLILRQRTSKAAHPEMKFIMDYLKDFLKKSIPIVFDDI